MSGEHSRPIDGVQEMAFTVPDLEQASAFFGVFFGAEPLAEGGPQRDTNRSTMRAFANADVRATIEGTRLLRTPFLNLRLIEATSPSRSERWPGMLDVGGWHLAAYVDDMDQAMEFLDTMEGVYVLGPGKKPTTNGPEVGEGSFACHGMTAWGFHFELLSYPNGRAYMDDFAGRLWNPAQPDRGATLRSASLPSIPGFRGFEHLSVAVGDLEEVSSFFEEALGCERFYDMGPMSDPHGSGFGAYANVDVRVRASKVRLLRTPYLNVELIEATFPRQNRDWPNLLDVGGWKLVFAVDDVDAAVEAVQKSGHDVHVLGGKQTEEVAGGTQQRVSCLTPFGFAFDFVDGVPGVGWHPAEPEA